MIDRVADPKDRRVLAAELTGDGRTLFEQIVAEQAKAERAIFDRLDTDELAALDTGLRALMTVLDDQLGPAPRRVSLALGDDQAIKPPR